MPVTLEKNSSSIVVVYHENCIDGVGSLWVLLKKGLKLESLHKRKRLSYIPYDYMDASLRNEEIKAKITKDTDLYFVDTAPTKELLEYLMTPDETGEPKLKSIHIYDHHEKAWKMLQEFRLKETYKKIPRLCVGVDQSRPSASRLIWDMLAPDEKPPKILPIIDKMDQSRLETDEDFQAAAFVDSVDISPPPRKALKNFQRGLSEIKSTKLLARKGIALDEANKKNIRLLFNKITYIETQIAPDSPPVIIPIVNGDVRFFGRRISRVLKALAHETKSGIAGAWHYTSSGIALSLRSDEAKVNCNTVATYFESNLENVKGGGSSGQAAVQFRCMDEFNKHILNKAVPQEKLQLKKPPKPSF